MKYLISGASGFIGSTLFMRLLKKKHEARAIPRDYLHNIFALKEYFEAENPDYIIHMAAYGNHASDNNLDLAIDGNIQTIKNMLQASEGVSYEKFINISTSSVSLSLQTPYSVTKKAAEHIASLYAQRKPVVSVRPYSVYGPGEADFRLIPKIIKHLKYNEPLVLVEKPVHDWVYVDDFLDGLELVIEKGDEKVYSIGTGIKTSNADIVRELENIHGESGSFEVVESLRSYDNLSWACNTSKMDKLGFVPKTTLREGLASCYEYY